MWSFSSVHKAIEAAGYTWTYEKMYHHYLHVFSKGELVVSSHSYSKLECYQKVKNWLKLDKQLREDEEEFCFT